MIKQWMLFLVPIALISVELETIILLGPNVDLQKPRVCGIQMEGIQCPKIQDDLEPILPWGKKIDQALVVEIQKEIIRGYHRIGHPIAIVEIPPQNLSKGTIQYRVVEGLLGEVRSTGNCWFSNHLYERAIHLIPGCPIDETKLLNEVALLNRSPFHSTNVVYTPSDVRGYIDVELVNRDRFPLRVYVGGDNTGTRQIERTRLFTGLDLGYAFGLDQVVSYQYCASPNFSAFQSHTFRYSGVLPWGHLFVLYGGFSTVHPHSDQFKTEGKSGQASLRYEIPIPSLFDGWLQELEIGFDGKSTNNNLIFSGSGDLSILQNTANLSQFVLGYDVGYSSYEHQFSLNTLFFFSPGKMLANESNEDLAFFRVGAKNQYLYGKSAASYQYIDPKRFTIWIQGRFQKSSRPLLASEQISIGGYDTVRGFDERLYNGDDGVIGNFEFQSPEIPLIEKYWTRCVKDRFAALVFFDCGFAELIEEIQDEPRRAFLSSTGAAVRYRIQDWFSARIAWGFKLHNVKSLGDTSLGKFHMGLIMSY